MWRKREPSYIVGGNVNWCSHYENILRFLKNLKIELPYNPAIPLLDIYPKKIKTPCPQMFIAALFTIAKIWKQTKCPLMGEWIRRCGTYIQWNITQP